MRFHAERKNLERIKKLEDPHLVRIIKSYKHGDVFNLVFPCARTNLGIYLRDKRFGATLEADARVEMSPLWRQLLGIAIALDKIINYCPPQPLPGEVPLYGYHCDLKPANILVEDSGTFVISDFGQARFKMIGGTSRITPLGGTEEYAPPEIDFSDPRYNRKYDIWSLGCIFLETCTFLVRGHDGVRHLDSVRSTRTSINIEDDRFFIRTPGEMRYAVKPEVQQWIRDLPGFCAGNERTSDFLNEFLSLVSQMLQVDIAKRSTSQEVCRVLSGILNRYQPALFQSLPKLNATLAFAPDDVEFGKEVLSNIQSMMYYADGDWKEGPVRIVEEPSHEMKVLTVVGSQEIRLQLGMRGQARLIPRYASHNQRHRGYADCHLYFSLVNSGKITFQPTKLFFRNSRDCVSVQSVLLGQDIRRSLSLSRSVFQRLPPLSSRIAKLLSSQKTVEPESFGKSTVQLWSEKSFRDRNAHLRQDSRNSVRKQFFSEPVRRRILVYQESSILIVRLAKNVRIERRPSTSASTILRIVPTDKARDSSFVASILSPSKHEVAAGIPLSRENLDLEEERAKFECRLLELNFETELQAKEFYSSYKLLKEEWHAEDKEIDRCKKDFGEVFGYSLD
jgi:serine/threonine protein kinase